MLTEYIQAAIDSITWKIMDDGSFYAELPALGLQITNAHLEQCQCAIREMLEDYIVVCLVNRKALPAINGKEIRVKETGLTPN